MSCPKHLAHLLKVDGNDVCADCKAKHPRWASVRIGIILCTECAGVHRKLGVHISFVQSLSMDKWKDEWIKKCEAIGNAKANAYYEANLREKDRPSWGVKGAATGDRMQAEVWAMMEKFARNKYERLEWAGKGIDPYKLYEQGKAVPAAARRPRSRSSSRSSSSSSRSSRSAERVQSKPRKDQGFVVTLTRKKDEKFGLQPDKGQIALGKLVVKEIADGTPAAKWNLKDPQYAEHMVPGDHVLSVNGCEVVDVRKAMEALRDEPKVVLVMQHAGSVKAAPAAPAAPAKASTGGDLLGFDEPASNGASNGQGAPDPFASGGFAQPAQGFDAFGLGSQPAAPTQGFDAFGLQSGQAQQSQPSQGFDAFGLNSGQGGAPGFDAFGLSRGGSPATPMSANTPLSQGQSPMNMPPTPANTPMNGGNMQALGMGGYPQLNRNASPMSPMTAMQNMGQAGPGPQMGQSMGLGLAPMGQMQSGMGQMGMGQMGMGQGQMGMGQMGMGQMGMGQMGMGQMGQNQGGMGQMGMGQMRQNGTGMGMGQMGMASSKPDPFAAAAVDPFTSSLMNPKLEPANPKGAAASAPKKEVNLDMGGLGGTFLADFGNVSIGKK